MCAKRLVLAGGWVFLACYASTATPLHAMSYGNPPLNYVKRPNYRAGTGATVSGWSTQSPEEAKKLGKPICLYVYDPTPGDNPFAEHLEGSKGLANGKLQAALSHFTCIKTTVAGKGWPEAWLSAASGSASIILISSDGKNVRIFGRNMGNDLIFSKLLYVAAAEVYTYELKRAELDKPARIVEGKKTLADPPVAEAKDQKK